MPQHTENESTSQPADISGQYDSLRSRELDLKKREVAAREREVAAKEIELRRSRWSNPLALGLLAAALGLLGNAIVAHINNEATLETERRRAQSNLIVEAMKTGKPEEACKNLVFFANPKLIEDPSGKIKGCAANPKTAPVLPSQGLQQNLAGLPTQVPCTGLDIVNQHVYQPARLEEMGSCLTVSGTVAGLKRERDGDYLRVVRHPPAIGGKREWAFAGRSRDVQRCTG